MKPKSKPVDSRKRILDDHRRIGALLSDIATATTAADTATHLQQLLPLLRRHFREEENEIDGLHTTIRMQTPQYCNELDELKKEHRDLLERTQQLLDQSERGGDARQLRTRGAELQQRLAAHETRETEVFVDSIWTDIGAVD
jgi:hypothetical protein